MRVYPDNSLDKFLKSPYREIFEIGTATGLRVSDILSLRVGQLRTEKPTITEKKTGKKKRIYIPKKTRDKLLKECSRRKPTDFVFKSTKSSCGHLTRQAVFKAFKTAAKNQRAKQNIGTHSMRKNYALRMKEKNKGLRYVQDKLNHASLGETLLYLESEDKP